VYLLNNIFNKYYYKLYKSLYILNYELKLNETTQKIIFNYEYNNKYIFKIDNNNIILNI